MSSTSENFHQNHTMTPIRVQLLQHQGDMIGSVVLREDDVIHVEVGSDAPVQQRRKGARCRMQGSQISLHPMQE
eukprot:6487087-Amphidinium_carterae.5